MSDWKKRDVWIKRSMTFAIEVSHQEAPLLNSSLAMDEGPHRWAVYAYVYPQHPRFGSFDPAGSMWQDAARAMPLHAGCSFFHAHRKADGSISSFQIGADYHHLYDDPYTHMATREDAGAIFAEAEELFRYLAEPAPTTPRSEDGGGKESP